MSRFVSPVFVALRQLASRKLLYGIATCGVLLGVFPLIAITGILRGFQGKFVETILANTPHVVLYAKQLQRARRPLDSAFGGRVVAHVSHEAPSDRDARIDRPTEVARSLERLQGVKYATGVVVGTAILAVGAREHPVELRGISPLTQDRVTPIRANLIDGDFRDFVSAPDGVILGAGVARDTGAKVGDTVTCAASRGDRITLRVVGVFETSVNAIDKARVYVPLRLGQAILGRGEGIDRIEVRLQDGDRAQEIADRSERIFGYDAESWQEANANFLGLFAQQNTIIGFVIGALLAVGGFGILSIQIMIVLQKRRDIAILRSVGFRRADVLLIVLLQGMLVSGLGAVLGAVAGHFTLDTLRHTHVSSGETFLHADTWLIHESVLQYVLAFAFAIGVGLASSLLPAWQASRVEPVDVLRGQT
jgi:lipoprotein-releasing system permease protein